MANDARVFVVTTEPPPLAGLATTGAGLRAWALGQGLKAAGHSDVTVVVAADAFAAQGVPTPSSPRGAPGVEAVPRARMAGYLRDQRPDVVVAQHWGIVRHIGDPPCPLALDLAGPHLLERRLWGSADPQADRREKLEALARADFVVCSGKIQRAYFLPYLLEAGFPLDPDLCPVIPFSMPPDLPTPAKDRDFSAFVFSGFFLPWQDPEQPLRWLLEELDRKDKGRLEFFGGMHPTLDVSRGKFESLAALVEGHPRVQMRGVVSFDELVLSLRRCGAALDLMPRNSERELAFPSRTVVYLWAGLPVLHNDYDDLAPLIERYRAGWTLDAENEDEFRRLVGRLVEHWEDVDRRSRGARELVQNHLTWDKTIGPLADWTRNPQRRAKKERVRIASGLSLSAVRTEKGPGGFEPSASVGERSEFRSSEPGRSDSEALFRARAEVDRLKGELETVRGQKVVQIARHARGLSFLLAPVVFLIAAALGVVLFFLFLLADAVALMTGRRPKIGTSWTRAGAARTSGNRRESGRT